LINHEIILTPAVLYREDWQPHEKIVVTWLTEKTGFSVLGFSPCPGN
jgi:hypothetical protein